VRAKSISTLRAYFSVFRTVKIDGSSMVSPVARQASSFGDPIIFGTVRTRSGEWKYPFYWYYLFPREKSFLTKPDSLSFFRCYIGLTFLIGRTVPDIAYFCVTFDSFDRFEIKTFLWR